MSSSGSKHSDNGGSTEVESTSALVQGLQIPTDQQEISSLAGPWLSINEMLTRNRCWLCKRIFPKGTKKMVFQLSDLIWYFNERWLSEKECAAVETMNSENLRDCYQSFKALSADNLLYSALQKQDLQMWMSGLVCGLNESCKQEADLICANSISGAAAGNSKIAKPADGLIQDGCLPGCGCDNPWAYLR